MEVIVCALVVVLFTLAPVEGVKKCEKKDACRCATDQGEISLWSLAGQTPNRARYVDPEDSSTPAEMGAVLKLKLGV